VFNKVKRYVVSRMGSISKMLCAEEGATIVEYILITAVVVIGLFAVFTRLREALTDKINEIINSINNIKAAPGT